MWYLFLQTVPSFKDLSTLNSYVVRFALTSLKFAWSEIKQIFLLSKQELNGYGLAILNYYFFPSVFIFRWFSCVSDLCISRRVLVCFHCLNIYEYV